MTKYKRNEALEIYDGIAQGGESTYALLQEFTVKADDALRTAFIRDVVEIVLGPEALSDFGIKRKD